MELKDAKRGWVLQGPPEDLREIDSLIEKKNLRIWDATWGSTEDYLKLVRYKKMTSATEPGE